MTRSPRMKESDMASSTEEHTIPELRNGPHARTGPPVPTTKSVFEHFREYHRDRPGVVALWCFGIGVVLGWKIKLW
jgi:hypothetical protein